MPIVSLMHPAARPASGDRSARACSLGLGLGLAAVAALAIAGCRPPDGTALRKLACEQAAASLDLHSISQMDALRKALGVAPDVDPIGACKALGANMSPRASEHEGAEAP